MQQIAQGIASLGRGDDKMLVHMTPGEVAGLQALAQRHGGSLTINPHTGLPEAGFLSSILPLVGAGIGIGLAPATGGASLWAMGGGALGGMLGSSMENKNPLLGALMGGISGYGMSGLANALTTAGSGLAGPEMVDVLGGTDIAMANSPTFVAPKIDTTGLASPFEMVDALGGTDVAMVNSPAIKPPTPGQFPQAKNAMWEGVKVAANKPVDFLKENWRPVAAVAAPLAVSGLSALHESDSKNRLAGAGAGAQGKGMIRPYTYKPGMYDPNYTQQVASRGYATSPYYSEQGYAAQPVYMAAEGGSVPNENQFYPGANIPRSVQAPTSAPTPTEVVGGYEPELNPYSGEPVRMAAGGIASLGTYAAGGKLLEGPGDGMSDSIPAVIQGEKPQRAALAQGEFVVPADVVSHLGNGSTDAGSKRLYAMMDKVRHARTGTKKQGKQIDAEKFIPA